MPSRNSSGSDESRLEYRLQSAFASKKNPTEVGTLNTANLPFIHPTRFHHTQVSNSQFSQFAHDLISIRGLYVHG